jgi:hypothetical protein
LTAWSQKLIQQYDARYNPPSRLPPALRGFEQQLLLAQDFRVMRNRSRTLRIQDAMILVLTAGMGLAGARFAISSVQLGLNHLNNEPYHPVARQVGIGFAGATAAFAVLVLYLRRVGARLRSRSRSAGIMGCCAIVCCVLVGFAWTAVDAVIVRPEEGFLFILLCGFSPQDFSLAVAGAWVALLASGRWRSRDALVDWAGLPVGASMMIWTTYQLWFSANG